MSTDDQMYPRGSQRNRPVHVDALASSVISVLRDRQGVSPDGLRQFVLDHLLRSVLSRDGNPPDVLMAELRGYRLSVDAIIDLYVPTVARMLGDDWVQDKINFAQVTIGIMRLQSLLSEASAELLISARSVQVGLNALVLIPHGEQHILGASVLAAQMRRLGSEVDTSYDEDFGTLTNRLMHCNPELVLITCARRETLESVAQTVQTIRNAIQDSAVIAVGGAMREDKDQVIKQTGVDIVTNIAEEAASFCMRRLKSRKSA